MRDQLLEASIAAEATLSMLLKLATQPHHRSRAEETLRMLRDAIKNTKEA